MKENLEEAIEKLKTELRNTQSKLSELRKAGSDTKIAELKIMNIPQKIQLAEATKNSKDVENVKSMLKDVKNELDTADNPDAKEDGAVKVEEYIEKMSKLLEDDRPKEAKDYYVEAVKIYSELENNDKKLFFGKLNELRDRLKRS